MIASRQVCFFHFYFFENGKCRSSVAVIESIRSAYSILVIYCILFDKAGICLLGISTASMYLQMSIMETAITIYILILQRLMKSKIIFLVTCIDCYFHGIRRNMIRFIFRMNQIIGLVAFQ